MRYFLDCEFNGFGGELLSLALVRQDGVSVYYVIDWQDPLNIEPWVAENVVPLLFDSAVTPLTVTKAEIGAELAVFFKGDHSPVVIADWPDDIRYLCEVLITGPGTCINISGLTFEWHRVDAYPNDGSRQLADAVQHNAWWDAMALRYVMTPTAVAKAA